MVERYTSPETSRALAEAGLERRIRSYGAYYVENELRRTQFELSVGPSFFAVRALDLTDCIHELTRPRPEEKDARPLATVVRIDRLPGVPSADWCAYAGCGTVSEQIEHESVCEAVALVLLALLKERK